MQERLVLNSTSEITLTTFDVSESHNTETTAPPLQPLTPQRGYDAVNL